MASMSKADDQQTETGDSRLDAYLYKVGAWSMKTKVMFQLVEI